MIESLVYPLLATLVGVLAFVAIGRSATSRRASGARPARGPSPALFEPSAVATGPRPGIHEATAPFERWLARARAVAPPAATDGPADDSTVASTDRSPVAGATRRPRAILPTPPIPGPRPGLACA